MNRVHDAFDSIHADEGLKDRTFELVRARAQEEAAKAAPSSGSGARSSRRLTLVGSPVRLAAAACFVLALVLGGGSWVYLTPTALISVDVNPSVELGVNRFDRVVSSEGMNEDGRALLESVDVWNLTYDEAVDALLDSDVISQILAEDGVAEVTVVSSEGSQGTRLLEGVEACTASRGNTYCHAASEEEAAEAHDAGLSCGKYLALVELQGLDSSITADDVRDMTMREIRDLIAELGGSSESLGSGDGSGHGAGESHGSHGAGAGSAVSVGDDEAAGAGSGIGSGAGDGTGSGAGDGTGSGHGAGHGSGSGTHSGGGEGRGSGSGARSGA